MEEDFGKEYRMHLRTEIDSLFREGRKIHVFPFLSHVLEKPSDSPKFSVVISIPKAKIKQANQRNRVKRMVRECLRKNKEPLLKKTNDAGCLVHFSLVYLSEEVLDYPKLDTTIKQIINRICV